MSSNEPEKLAGGANHDDILGVLRTPTTPAAVIKELYGVWSPQGFKLPPESVAISLCNMFAGGLLEDIDERIRVKPLDEEPTVQPAQQQPTSPGALSIEEGGTPLWGGKNGKKQTN